MSGTKRVPVARTPIPQITPRSIELFDAMKRCCCTCPPIDWEGKWGRQQCPGCKRWWELQNELCDELRTKPWEYPCVEDPRTENPYLRGMPAHATWEPNHRAQAMWRQLHSASRERRREERAARRAKANGAPDQPPAT